LPNLTLDYAFTDNQKIYANISRGFSNPSVEETLTPDGVINPDIAQETGTNYELGTQLFFDQKRFKIDISLYQMSINNLLVGERIDEDRFVGRNAGKTRHNGLELGLNYTWDVSKNLQIAPFANYAFNDHSFIEFNDEGIDYSGNALTGVPKITGTTGLQLRFFQHFYWNTTHQYVSAIPLTDAGDLDSDAFSVFTSRMGYFKKLTDNFTLGIDFGINNLFDTVYAQSVLINTQAFGGREPRYYYPGDARNYYGSVRLGYKI